MRDPRSHRRYRTLAAAYKRQHHGEACALCHLPVVSRATIEHRLPVRTILAMSSTDAEALALACDTSMWGMAHSRCQSQQGARAVNERKPQRVTARQRDW